MAGKYNIQQPGIPARKWRNNLHMLLMLYCMSMYGTTTSAQSQPGDIPSRIHTWADTASIDSVIERANGLRYSHPDSAIQLAQYAFAHSIMAQYHYGAARALGVSGVALMERGHYQEAAERFRQGVLLTGTNEDNIVLRAQLYSSLGNAYFYQGLSDSAASASYKARDILEAHKQDQHAKASGVYNNLAGLWYHMQDMDQFLYFISRSEAIALRYNSRKDLANIYANKGSAYMHLKPVPDSAWYYFTLVRQLRPDRYSTPNAAALLSTGMLLNNRNKPEQAIPYFKEVLDIGNETGNPQYRLNALYELGNAYARRYDHKQAEAMYLDALKIQESAAAPAYLTNIYGALSRLYAAMNLYDKAYAYQEKAYESLKPLTDQEVQKNIRDLDIRYRSAEKDKKIAQDRLRLYMQQNSIRKKNIWIGIISGIAILAVAAAGLGYRYQQKIQRARIRNIKQQQKITQLHAVMQGEEQERTRMAQELHDGVGGMLAAIKMNVSAAQSREDPRQAARDLTDVMQLVEDTANEVRRTAHNLMPAVLTNHTFPEAIRFFCDKVNKLDRLQIDLRFLTPWENPGKSFELALYRILQELIQNVVKHADATHLIIQFRQHDNMLHVTVEDNGKGFRVNGEKKGIGLHNIRSRVEVLQGIASIESVSGSGTTCYLEFNLLEYKTYTHEHIHQHS